MIRTTIIALLICCYISSGYTQLANFVGNSEIDGKLRIDRPSTFQGDVPLTIDAIGSPGWYSGLKTTYGTNTTYIFGIDDINGGIEVVKQNFFYAPVLASDFVLMPASVANPGTGRRMDQDQINALDHLSSMRAHLITADKNVTGPNHLGIDPNTIPDIILSETKGVAGTPGGPHKAINTASWLSLISEGINELSIKTKQAEKFKTIIEDQERRIQMQQEQIDALLRQIEQIEIIETDRTKSK